MRLKKVILVLDDNEPRRRVRRFVLEVRGPYIVLSGERLPRHPGARLADLLCRVDVAIVDVAAGGSELCGELAEQLRGVRIVQVGGAWEDSMAQACLARRSSGQQLMAELLESVRVMAQRKRGPQKGWRGNGELKRERDTRNWKIVQAAREWMAA
jgi:CheY-like chemotaxis protein